MTVEPEGIVAIPNFNERSFIIYNIGKPFLSYLLSHLSSSLLQVYNVKACSESLVYSLMVIVCEEQLLGIAYSCWSVVVLVVLCLVVALILPRFLPSHLLIKDGDRHR